MLTRRKILYNMISFLDRPTSFRIQKSLFIYSNINKDNPPYAFFPNKRGCYSVCLKDDYHVLCNNSCLERDELSEEYRIAESANADLFSLPEDKVNQIKSIANFCNQKTDEELIQYTYKTKPFYSCRSEVLYLMKDDEEFQKKLNGITNKMANRKHAIYTIGYEAASIDKLLRTLIYYNIKTLVDVRKNAFSMRMEFSKERLIEACKEAGIEYVHCPEVGIVTEKRKELLPEGKEDELFEWYKENVLPQHYDFINKAYTIFENGSLCFFCYEKDARDCHRSRLADFCLENQSGFNEIINLSAI